MILRPILLQPPVAAVLLLLLSTLFLPAKNMYAHAFRMAGVAFFHPRVSTSSSSQIARTRSWSGSFAATAAPPLPQQRQHSILRLAATPPPSTDAAVELGSSTEKKENYDIVTVDLENGRDYPIYIGTDYAQEEGMCQRVRRERNGRYSLVTEVSNFASFP
jgi:hypothetical protein